MFITFIISDHECFKKFLVRVSEEILISDHSHLEVSVTLNVSCHRCCSPKWFLRQLWDRIDVNLYQCVLDDILSRIRIPFHLLSQSQKFHLLELDIYYAEIVHAMKVVGSVVIPVIRVHRNTQKWDGLLYQGYMKQNRKIGYGIIFGINVTNQEMAPFSRLLNQQKRNI